MTQDALYNAIGRSYVSTRRPDRRVIDELVRLLGLPLGSTIGDVGAGSGNYTNALAEKGYNLLAVEPSVVMRGQARPHRSVRWHTGTADSIPLGDGSAAGIVCTLAAHHFPDIGAAIEEMNRVCPYGPIVFFTMDPRRGQPQWFAEYFPEIRKQDFEIFPAVKDFAGVADTVGGRQHEVIDFPLPSDLSDHFMYAPWAKPEIYLDGTFRANTSGFAKADPQVVERRVAELAADLASGAWDRKFGSFRTQSKNDAGFCFVVLRR